MPRLYRIRTWSAYPAPHADRRLRGALAGLLIGAGAAILLLAWVLRDRIRPRFGDSSR